MQSKYYKSDVEPAIDSAIRVGLEQLMETIEHRVYDTVGSSTSYHDTRDELQNLQCVVENYSIIHKGASLETIIGDVVKTVVYKALGLDGDENSSWVSPDELAKRNPNKFRKVEYLNQPNSSEVENVTVLALETLLEQVTDAENTEQIDRVKNVLKYKHKPRKY